jgi:hypothetical protein
MEQLSNFFKKLFVTNNNNNKLIPIQSKEETLKYIGKYDETSSKITQNNETNIDDDLATLRQLYYNMTQNSEPNETNLIIIRQIYHKILQMEKEKEILKKQYYDDISDFYVFI